MKLSELISVAASVFAEHGDLECFIESDDDENERAPIVEMLREFGEDGTSTVLLTQYCLPYSPLQVVK